MLAALIAVTPAAAQGVDTVTVDQRVLVAGDITPAEAKRRAIEGALGEAVRRVVGVRVQSGQFGVTDDRDGRVTDSFLSVIQLDAGGRATDYRVVDEGWEPTRHPELGSQLYYHATLVVSVERERGERDAGFHASLSLNDALFFDNGAAVAENDEVVATIASTRAGYATLFTIADDSVQRLVPNDFVRTLAVPAGGGVEFPSADWRARGLHLRTRLPAGVDRRRELLMAVVTRTAVPPPLAAHPSPLDIQRWLIAIPVDQRAVAFAAYEVRRR
jgi:hypothetical protein